MREELQALRRLSDVLSLDHLLQRAD